MELFSPIEEPRKPVDAQPEPPQLLVQALVAAVQMGNCVHRGRPFGGQSGQHQRGARPQVGSHDPRTAEPLHTRDRRRRPADGDPRAPCGSTRRRGGICLERRGLRSCCGRRPATKAPSIGLADRWECRDTARRRCRSPATDAPRSDTRSPAASISAPHSANRVKTACKCSGAGPQCRGLAAADRRGQQQGGRFDAVGDDAMHGAGERVNATHFDCRSPQARDARPHRAEETAEVNDFRFAGGGEDLRGAAGQGGGTEDVGRAGDRRAARAGKIDRRAAEAVGAGRSRSRDRSLTRPQGRPGPSGADRRAGRRGCSRRAGGRSLCPAAPPAARGRRSSPASAAPSATARTRVGSIVSSRRPSAVQATAMPSSFSSKASVPTSATHGARCNSTGPSARIAAAIIGRAAFFDPPTSTSPQSGLPPWMVKKESNQHVACIKAAFRCFERL